jgi:hypothetical protein
MACQGFVSVIRKFWNEVTPELQKIVADITAVTQVIKNLETDPTVEEIVAAIPAGSTIERWLNTALGAITGVTTEVTTIAAAITAWLNGAAVLHTIENAPTGTAPSLTKPAKDMMLFKLASQAVKAADIEAGTGSAVKGDAFYDDAVQTHLLIVNAA